MLSPRQCPAAPRAASIYGSRRGGARGGLRAGPRPATPAAPNGSFPSRAARDSRWRGSPLPPAAAGVSPVPRVPRWPGAPRGSPRGEGAGRAPPPLTLFTRQCQQPAARARRAPPAPRWLLGGAPALQREPVGPAGCRGPGQRCGASCPGRRGGGGRRRRAAAAQPVPPAPGGPAPPCALPTGETGPAR